MSLEQAVLNNLDTQSLLDELKRRGVEPCIVPGLEQAPDLFVLETLIGRLDDHEVRVSAARVKYLIGQLDEHYSQVLLRYTREHLLDVIGDDVLWEAIGDQSSILDHVSDESLWEAISADGQRQYRGDSERLREVLEGLRSKIVDEVDEALNGLEDQ